MCFTHHIGKVLEDLGARFRDLFYLHLLAWVVLFYLHVPEWVVDPYSINTSQIATTEYALVDELIELCHDSQAQVAHAKSYKEMWMRCFTKYSELWKRVEIFILAFPSSYSTR